MKKVIRVQKIKVNHWFIIWTNDLLWICILFLDLGYESTIVNIFS